MSVFPRSLSKILIFGLAIILTTSSCDCGEEEPEEQERERVVVPERDRASEIPAPEMVGVAPDDFDPDEKSRIVELDQWNVSLRAAGLPGAMPTEIVAVVDRSVVRRGYPQIGPGTIFSVTDEEGREISVAEPRLTDRYSVFRAEIEDDLVPGTTYQVAFESVEFTYDDDEGQEDVEFLEFGDPPRIEITTPPMGLVDVSNARTVGAFGHVELRFSAPVEVSELQRRLQWSLDGSSTAEVYYEHEEGSRVATARIRSSAFSFNAVSQIRLTGQGVVSTLGGDASGAIDETIEVGSSSDSLEIRMVGVYVRAGLPTIRVICHDPNFGDNMWSYWDREIYRSSRDISRRCDVDPERALELVELDVDADLSFVDHQHGFDLVLQLEEPGGPVGFALRTGQYGEDLAELFEGHEELLVPSLPAPELAIEADGRYLKRADWKRIPIRHRDVELARVVVRHAVDEHFMFWLAGPVDHYSRNEAMSTANSFAIAEQYIELDPGPSEAAYSYLDLEALLGDPRPGAYQIEISAPYQRGVGDSHRFLVSDIQLLAKRAHHKERKVDEVWAWAINADTAEPISEVSLELTRRNGQVLATCETDDQGYCSLSGNWGDLEDEPPFAVVAEGGAELAYIDWVDTKTHVVEGAIGGADYGDTLPYTGAINGERTLYRPGETMSFAGFVRGEGYGAAPGLPVGIEITDSRGQRAYGGVQETDSVGAVEFWYDVPEMASTGTYKVELFVGDEEIARQEVTVEEFVPERIEVELSLDEEYVYDGDGIDGRIDARYYFGTPAADTKFEIECRFEATQPFRDEWPQYTFGPFADQVDSQTARFEGTLAGDGRAQFNCDPDELDERASYTVTVKAAVFEAGSGSPTRAEDQTLLLPGPELVGLRSPDDRVDSTDGARIEGIVVGPGGKIVERAGSVDLAIGSIRYSSTRVHRGGRVRWERERHESIDERQTVNVDSGRFSLRVAPRGNTVGVYLRADRDGAVTEFQVDSPQRFWGWGQRDLDPRPDDPAHIAIDGPEELTVGQPGEFSFEAPAAGRALVALETARVDSWQWLEVEPGLNTWDVTVDYFDANVYVSVLYVPTGDNVPAGLDRGFGVQRVRVARDQWRAHLELDVPEEREPFESFTVGVSSDTAGPNAKVVVAAVDRGILSMASFEYEDPLEQLFRIRALGVDTFDTVGWYADVSPERFGGGAYGPPQPGPSAIMPVRPTAMWSGLVELQNGEATIEFDIPDFRGELEIVAVLVDEEYLGRATERMRVVDPLALQATAPRFATHGDRFQVPLSVTNTTDSAIDVEITADVLPDMELAGDDRAALEITSASVQSVRLQPNERGELLFHVEVTGRAGAPRLTFEATGGGHRSQHFATVPVYPDGPTTTEHVHHSISTRGFNVATHLDGWLATSETTELWVTSIPRAPAFVHLDHVLRYPRLPIGRNLYNTVARVRPVIYLDKLLEAADPDRGSRSFNWRISSGIRGIERLQDRSGQFRFWPTGGGSVDAWGQAYVLDMLTAADDAGHAVPDWVMRNGLDWLDLRVQRRQNLEDLDLPLWVLSRQGRPNRRVARALLDELPDNPTGRNHERALLATASLYRGGDETVEGALRELIQNPRIDERTFRPYGDHYSAARHEGLILDVAIEIFGTDHDLVGDLVEKVADRLVDAEVGDLNLHELGWSISSLGRWAEARAGTIPASRLIAAGVEVQPQVVGEDGSRSWRLHRASEYPDVSIEFDETPSEPVTLFRRTEGVHSDGEPEYGNRGLQLTRRYRDANGNPTNLNNVRVGDLIYVELEATHGEPRTLQNLALTDRIPGGFEIEDPRPEGDVRPSWFENANAWRVDHFDVRDDRMEIFGSIPRESGLRATRGQRVKFLYTIRATTAGTFNTPPAELVSMYQKDRWARIQGSPVRISRP